MFATLKNLFGGANDSPNIEYWMGKIGLTLMMCDNQLDAHVQTDIRRATTITSRPSPAFGGPHSCLILKTARGRGA